MRIAPLVALLLVGPALSGAVPENLGGVHAFDPSLPGVYAFDTNLLDIDRRLTDTADNITTAQKTQVVTKVSSDLNVGHMRLGANYFYVGVALQVCGLVAMLIGVLAATVTKINAREARGEEGDWDEMLPEGLQFIWLVFQELFKRADFAKFFFTVLAYVVLDSLYKATFIGDELFVYDVSTTCTAGMECVGSEPYGVIASTMTAAVGATCNQFKVHNPECSELAALKDARLASACNEDALLLSEVYFQGYSRSALSVAFVLGCLMSLILNLADLLVLCGKGWVVTALLGQTKSTLAETLTDESKTNAVYQQTVKSMSRGDKNSLRVQQAIRTALDGLSYGLMMLVLEVQVDNDCVELRAMLPINMAYTFAIVIIATACIFFAVATVVFVFEKCSTLLRISNVKDCMAEPGPCQRLTSFVFKLNVIILVVVSMIAYAYSVVLSFYLAYMVPSDSAVILGAILTALAIATQLVGIVDPKPPTVACTDDYGDTEGGYAESPFAEDDEYEDEYDQTS